MQTRLLDPSHSEATAWYAAWHAGNVAGREQPTVAGAESVLGSLRTNATNAVLDRQAWGAWDGDECLGGVIVNMPRTSNTHTAEFELAVAPRHRRRGVGAALYEAAAAVARANGRRVISAELNVPLTGSLAEHTDGRFALARGFESKLTERRYLLSLPAEPRTSEAPTGYRLQSWTGPVSAESAPGFAAMRTLMEQDVPTGERDHEPDVFTAPDVLRGDERMSAAGWGLVTSLLHAPDGTPAGYTRVVVNADRLHAQQDDTFVLRAHRGRRLGAVLKSANLVELAAGFPTVRHLHTWTAEGNDAMIATNRRFGFHPVEAMHVVEGELPQP
ncbi:GNAT family N-acetyltransferase [Actinoplanes sp. CA-054009]